ncbi:ribbon-helix-helix domain-containing protein [Xanthobacteraceae bacterium Astr-EGSB]|uniref:ribbon-helix-helix domain-containing protein n=1 Tax=Astrobacterium formosum TaxID=3069710 RepID=UPI0027B6A598|nr:ribbon-helix-helix domain-containing protein [Xanthobacteraceae bacterium Astr-EGSB]
MTSLLSRRTVRVGGDSRDITIEDQFWLSLEEIAARQGTTTSQLVTRIDHDCRGENLSSAIRVYVIDHFMTQAQDLDDEEVDDEPAPMPARPRWLN